ncbi:PREDICTED: uncharacterized protein LOC104703419 [Camelina sativa]|uniref:Uncharacterized protein LOC104703419 n=1 Tax=Camelina sativa TaxID=90675 RepID=A0ABM0SXX7_CAMSA|nr:PREDICTED: uncharacterized protein LOC104703419 [Camelina sativa]
MAFLLKVKRAKYLSSTVKKDSATNIRKHHWLLEQKLLNFVDAFHQYVYHTAVVLSIQRQCFVVQETLWAIIGSRINMIIGLTIEFYSVQQTLSSGGAVSGIKARCEMEIDRILKQF